MKAFRFPLDRALKWRSTQLEMERMQLRRVQEQQAATETERRNLEGQDRVPAAAWTGAELQFMPALAQWAEKERRRLDTRAKELRSETESAFLKVAAAQRKVKLLERLRQRRLEFWTSEGTKEEELFATEAWLGRYGR